MCFSISFSLPLSPRWETLDDGSWASSLMWLKPHAAYTTFHANRQYTVKPSMHDKLWELQVRVCARFRVSCLRVC